MPHKKNIIILNSQVPFSWGGAEVLVSELKNEFVKLGHTADVVTLPFLLNKKEDLISQSLNWRALDLRKVSGKEVDLVIATKFPTYHIRHPKKITWLIHQHRQAFELLATRFGDVENDAVSEMVRSTLVKMDRNSLSECKALFTISENVSKRVKDFLDLESSPVEPPVNLALRSVEVNCSLDGNLLFVGRLCSSKRLELIIRALPMLPKNLRLKLIGVEDEPGYRDFIQSEIEKHHLNDRVDFLGKVSNEDLGIEYQKSFAVVYPPFDEDFGFISFEAALFGKPLITTEDAGYVADIIRKFNSGVICKSDPTDISQNINKLINSSEEYQKLKQNCRLVKTEFSWTQVVEKFVSYA